MRKLYKEVLPPTPVPPVILLLHAFCSQIIPRGPENPGISCLVLSGISYISGGHGRDSEEEGRTEASFKTLLSHHAIPGICLRATRSLDMLTKENQLELSYFTPVSSRAPNLPLTIPTEKGRSRGLGSWKCVTSA